MINHILGNIYIGDDRDTSKKNLKRLEITAMLDLRELHIDEKLDEDAILEVKEATVLLEVLLRRENKVLVYCHAGIDRSPFVVAHYLYRIAGYSIQDAYDLMKHHRPQTIQHWEWFKQFTV